MTEDEALAAAERQAHIHETLTRTGEFLEQVANREIPERLWEAPQPAPVRRQPEPPPPKPKPDPAPPVPNEILRTKHDSAGRIVEVEKYSGSAAAAKNSWEHWIRQHVESRLKIVYETIGEVMGQMAKEERAAIDARMAEESGRLAEAVRVLGQAVETLNGRMKSLEARLTAVEPMEMRDAAD